MKLLQRFSWQSDLKELTIQEKSKYHTAIEILHNFYVKYLFTGTHRLEKEDCLLQQE